MTVKNGKEVLVESLTHVGSQDEVVLVFLVGIVNTESLSSRVGKPGDDVGVEDFGFFKVGGCFELA